VSFYSVSSFLTEPHLQEKSTFAGEWSKFISMTNSKTFSDSNVIQDLSEFLCTICEADLNMPVDFYGDIKKKDKNLLLEICIVC
jgi:hypothetical protein